MTKNFEALIKYFKEEDVEYFYDNNKNVIYIVIGKSNSGKKIFAQIFDNQAIVRVYMSMKIGDNIKMDKNIQYRLFEYFHRANLGMLRGNFEYDIENKGFCFKNYFESEMISNKNYVMYNIVLPVIMYRKYAIGIKDVIKTKKSVKSIIRNIEKDI